MDRAAFFDSLRGSKLFGGSLRQEQVRGITGILDAFDEVGDGRPKTLAYVLATVRRECGPDMLPVREGFARTDAEARRKVKALGRRYAEEINGHVYYGRGYVQLTWAANYKASSRDAKIDLLRDPDAALDPKIAARLCVRGIQDGRFNAAKKGIAFYLPTNGPDDLKNARRTVNLTDHWEEIAGHYRVFLAAAAAGGGLEADEPMPVRMTDAEAEALQRLVAWRAEAPTPEDLVTAEKVAEWQKRMPS